MRFAIFTILLATAVVNANPVPENLGDIATSAEDALAKAAATAPELVSRKDWLCDPVLQSCGTGDPAEAHYCRPNSCTGWHGCIPYTTSTGQRYAWCS
ncbi:hypothetical protein COCMIDRAFT_36587 [Bipolaris oryzae ATCC 44560]|uniref:Uncharacterized protein n=1 Tax=Bipolaris oryzae ATCC 44560 TaxID=930090 RepID=W6Z6U5_COCMI|nr:uncharacterized protein COCMIDRAFT_36587 [Bipolaris oryzae ATCC 44560]EUC45690.1 hypothetical protein COCMIDRAFT_36587 [Bipolaris oryzae ATCC 44560]